MAFLDHRELKIIKGIGSTPGDTDSAEQQPVVVNLMDSNGGIALDGTNGAWSPQIPSVKPLWAENPANDGRTLIAGALNNVTETIRLIITGSDATATYSNLRRLYDMRQDLLDFWQTESQIEPVYLKWWANCGAGPQFALIYTMDIAAEFMNSERPAIQVTLTIEREFGWRGIPPGANPKLWTFYVNKYTPTALTDWNLGTGLNHLFTDTCKNRFEWNTTQTAVATKNYVDIPAASIPGDLPAFTSIHIAPTITSYSSILIGKSLNPTQIKDRATGTTTYPYANFNAGDGLPRVDATITADATAPASNSSASGQRVTVSFATDATMIERLRYENFTAGIETRPNMNLLRGRYLVFLRAKLSAASTVLARVQFGYTFGSGLITPVYTLGDVSITQITNWNYYYMGQVTFPFWDKSYSGINGLGLDINAQSSSADLCVSISAQRTGGATNLHLADILMMPFDEGAIKIEQFNAEYLIDQSGYLTHGRSEATYGYSTPGSGTFFGALPFSGQTIGLTPGVNNRIYAFAYDAVSNTTDLYNYDTRFRINIVPRWAGIRDT